MALVNRMDLPVAEKMLYAMAAHLFAEAFQPSLI